MSAADLRLGERLAAVRTALRTALLAQMPAIEDRARVGGRVDLWPLEETIRGAVREVGRIRAATDNARPAADAQWWECPDCRGKLASVTAMTVTIVRKDLTVFLARAPDTVLIVACPRCKGQQEFPNDR
jgi:hypothetical protein